MKRLISLCIAVWFVFQSFPSVVEAHMYDEGYSYAHIDNNQVTFELLLPFTILWHYDLDGDYFISNEELMQQWDEISDYMEEHIELYNGIEKMEFELVGLEPTMMQATESYVVKFNFLFTSTARVEELTIRYRAIFADIEPIHQNYVQLYKDDVMIDHRVLFRDAYTFQYAPNQKPRFTALVLSQYILLGVQSIVQSFWHIGLLLAIALASRKLKLAIENGAIFAAANLIGIVLTDRINLQLNTIWLYSLLTILIIYLFIIAFKKMPIGARPIAIIAGLLHGYISLSALINIGVYREFKTVTMAAYDIGLLVAVVGCIYVAANLLSPLQNKFLTADGDR